MSKKIAIIGAGLAGSEAALVLARHGVQVTLFEMRPEKMTPAHKTGTPAELVCTNSLKSDQFPSAPAVLKRELRSMDSPLMAMAESVRIPAGNALAVDREQFSQLVEQRIDATPEITRQFGEVTAPPEGYDIVVIATGPLTSEALTQWITATFGQDQLNFYDAIAPIVAADSVDMDKAFYASRWDDDTADYLNCPFSKEEYYAFYEALREADQVSAHDFEDHSFFEACLPIEEMASRGERSLTFGPLKPVGLTNPRTGRWPYAVCQLRSENRERVAFNLVGFQTRLRYGDQDKVFRKIPGLEHAEFLRFGSIHRNTYLNSPELLTPTLNFKARASLYLAGQICGNEGYTESIATGHCVARFILGSLRNIEMVPPPPTTAIGALIRHVTAFEGKKFSPTNINFGLFPPLENPPKRQAKDKKKQMICDRAEQDFTDWMQRYTKH